MIKAVLDANVWVSGLISSDGPPGKILDSWFTGVFQVMISPAILNEIIRVFQYPGIRNRIAPDDLQRLMLHLVEAAEISSGEFALNVLTIDPDDNIYLACALESHAEYLVTGNGKHFAEVGDRFRGVWIVDPARFLQVLADA